MPRSSKTLIQNHQFKETHLLIYSTIAADDCMIAKNIGTRMAVESEEEY